MATISDIAKQANVSQTLVSRVLNNKPGVSPENREKILKIIRECNYIPNALARALVSQSTQTIGVVMDDLRDKFFFDLISGMQDMSEHLGYNIIFCSGRDNQDVKSRYVDYFLHGRADGLIAFGSRLTDGHVYREISEKAKHFVLIEGNIPGYEFNKVRLDNTGGAYRATAYLLERGYRKIWHVTGDLNYSVTLERMNGFLKALCDHNATVTEESIIHADFEEGLAYRRVGDLIRSHKIPDAIFAGADKTAFGVIRALTDNGLRIPDDVAVIGFDGDKPDTYDRVFPKLTTMRQPLYEMGKAGVELLVRSMQDPGRKPEIIVLDPEFIIGETCL